jgi:hypothetical protein
MTLASNATAAVTETPASNLVLWPDGTWCWQDDFRAEDYAWVSDDYEVIDMADMPAVQRIAIEHPGLVEEILRDFS